MNPSEKYNRQLRLSEGNADHPSAIEWHRTGYCSKAAVMPMKLWRIEKCPDQYFYGYPWSRRSNSTEWINLRTE